MFLFPASGNMVYEILKFDEDHRSWFIGEHVQQGESYNHSLLTRWGLMTPYDDIELGQHWLR